MAHDPEIKQKYKAWLMLPEKERSPRTKAALARQYKVTPQTLNNWDKETEDNIDGGDLARQIELMDTAVYNAATVKQIAKMAELWYRRHGLLIDKSETTHKFEISANELTRGILQARRELEDSGMAQMQLKPSIFSGNLWLDSGQDKPQDG